MNSSEPTPRETWLSTRRFFEWAVRQEPSYGPWLEAVDWGLREGAADRLFARNVHFALSVRGSGGKVVVEGDPAGAMMRLFRPGESVLGIVVPREQLAEEFARLVGLISEASAEVPADRAPAA